MTRNPLLLLALFSWVGAFAQAEQRFGHIQDQTTRQPVFRASISISGREAGTYANDHGTFVLSGLSANDTLIFSALGYQTRWVPMQRLSDTIQLSPLSYELPVVDFSATPEKEHVVSLGFRKQKIRGGLVARPGYQFARYVANPFGEAGGLAAATFQFPRGERSEDNGGIFRVRVFARKPGMNTFHPGRDLLLEAVEFSTNWKGGFFSISLREYGIVFPPEGLFIGLEYLAKTGSRPLRESGKTYGPVLGKYTTTNGKALTVARFRDNFWSVRNLPRWREEEVPNMAFGAIVVYRR